MNKHTFEYKGHKVQIIQGVKDPETPGYYRGSRAMIDGSPACMNPVNGTLLATWINVRELIDRTSV